MPSSNKQFVALRTVVIAGMLIMLIKFIAYFITHSNAILTDALESIINVVAGVFALYSVKLSAKPRDKGHPYGHGKIEFISAGFEGGLIFIAAIAIIGKSIDNLIHPVEVHRLDTGILLSGLSGLFNYILGAYLVKTGNKHHSITLVADGKHLISDTYSSIGLIAGLLIMQFTQLLWMDNVIAILFGCIILVTGYKLVRKSLAGLMDEADEETLNELVRVLNRHRSNKWIDIHNLRVLRYGSFLHIDCHITLPWYEDLQTSHQELKKIENIINKEFDRRIEIFIHPDPCLPSSCAICALHTCNERKHAFKKQIEWELNNLLSNSRHHL